MTDRRRALPRAAAALGAALAFAAAATPASAQDAPAVTVPIRPAIDARIDGVRVLGAPLRVVGALRPASAGRLTLSTGGAARPVSLDAQGRFSVRIPSRRAGRVCAQLRLVPAPGYAAVMRGVCASVRTPALALGSHGRAVRFLEGRLAGLHYLLRGVDDRYLTDTRDAVYAFQKVEGLARDGVAGPQLWRRLRVARTPRAAQGGSYLQVDKARQVLFEVRGGRVAGVAHVSTGATGNTPVGAWRIYIKTPGYNAKAMYDSMYFLRGFAIHGYASVPPYPASHGCVRVPLWLAPGLYARWPLGTLVVVRP